MTPASAVCRQTGGRQVKYRIGREMDVGEKEGEIRCKPWGPEEIEQAGFRLELISHLMLGRRKVAKGFIIMAEVINLSALGPTRISIP